MSKKYLLEQPDQFYGQICDYWEEIKDINLPSMSLNDILNEKLCFNKNILIGNKPITNIKFMHNNIIRLNDLLKPDLTFKTNADFSWLSVMEYNQVMAAIPSQWKLTFKDSIGKKIQFNQIGMHQIKIGIKFKEIICIKCKDFYWHLINKTYVIPTAVNRSEELN